MAEVIEVDDTIAAQKTGRHSKFTAAQDLVIAREVAAAKAHISCYGETKKRFEMAASEASENPLFEESVSWKTVQDRYKRLQEQYDTNDTENQRLSGVGGGEMGEMADLLMSMREAGDDFMAQKKAVKNAEKKKEEDKEKIGKALVELATKRRVGSEDEENEIVSIPDAEGSARKKRKSLEGVRIGMEMDRFGGHLKESEIARVDLERERLLFEREKDMADRAEREGKG